MSTPTPVLIRIPRSITGSNSSGQSFTITADAVIEESHSDEATVTKHPVEQGATISDHAYKLPAELTLEYGWAMGSSQNTSNDITFLRKLYQQLLDLQVNRTLVQVLTGKRSYTNMFVAGIHETTDKHHENVLIVRLHLQEVLIATTQILQLSSQAVQLLPERTAPVINNGFQNLGTAPNFNPSVPEGL